MNTGVSWNDLETKYVRAQVSFIEKRGEITAKRFRNVTVLTLHDDRNTKGKDVLYSGLNAVLFNSPMEKYLSTYQHSVSM